MLHFPDNIFVWWIDEHVVFLQHIPIQQLKFYFKRFLNYNSVYILPDQNS